VRISNNRHFEWAGSLLHLSLQTASTGFFNHYIGRLQANCISIIINDIRENKKKQINSIADIWQKYKFRSATIHIHCGWCKCRCCPTRCKRCPRYPGEKVILPQWAKSPKKQSVRVYIWQYGTVYWVPNQQKTHTFRLFFLPILPTETSPHYPDTWYI